MTAWRDLPGLLTWTLAADHLDALRGARSAAADDALGQALGRLVAVRHPELDAVLHDLSDLPPPDLRRVLDAPRTQTVLRRCPPDHVATYLRCAAAAERGGGALPGRLRARLAESTCAWCTLVLHDGGQPSLWSCQGDRATAADGTPLHTAQRVSQGPVVDVVGPAVVGPLPDVPGAALPLGPEQVRRFREIVRTTVEALHEGSPPALELVTALTQVVVCRRDPTVSGSCAASSAGAIGQTVLRNPHAESVGPVWLVEGLVHEAVHAAIDILQLDAPMLLDPDAARVRLTSPWTGRSLDLDTYLQACWVWFALAHLWRELQGHAFPEASVLPRWEQSLRGFARGAALTALAPHEAVVAPAVLSALDEALEQLVAVR